MGIANKPPRLPHDAGARLKEMPFPRLVRLRLSPFPRAITLSMVTAIAIATALAIAPAQAANSFGLEVGAHGPYPLLPAFFETLPRNFVELGLSWPLLTGWELQGRLAQSLPYLNSPYDDTPRYHSSTRIFMLDAEWEAYRIGTARFVLQGGAHAARSTWDARGLAYEDPREPREYWHGGFTLLGLQAAPAIELFRERQAVDWTLSFAVPFYMALAEYLDGRIPGGLSRFRKAYLDETGFGFRLAIGLGFNRKPF
jgi:hypothetical protein